MAETKKFLDFDFKNAEQARVPVALIRENKDSLRPVDRQDPDYLTLVDSVRKHGVMQPISVRKVVDPTDGKTYYGLIDGLHRYNASIDAGLDTIAVSIGTLEETQLLAAQILANVQKVETKPVQYTKAIIKLMAADPTVTRGEMASRLSKTTGWLDDRLSLVKLEPTVAALVDEGKIVLTNAYHLSKLPFDEQVALKEKAMTDSPATFGTTATNRQKEIAKAKREGRPAVQEFIPQERAKRNADIKAEITASGTGTGTVADLIRKLEIKSPIEAACLALKWVLHVDPDQVAIDKAKWTADKAANEAKKNADKIAREKKKLEELTGAPVISSTPAAAPAAAAPALAAATSNPAAKPAAKK